MYILTSLQPAPTIVRATAMSCNRKAISLIISLTNQSTA